MKLRITLTSDDEGEIVDAVTTCGTCENYNGDGVCLIDGTLVEDDTIKCGEYEESDE